MTSAEVTISGGATYVTITSGGSGASTPGVGVPVGGTTGQALVKISNANFDTQWMTIQGGGGGGTGAVSSVAGKTGVVTLQSSDIIGLVSILDSKAPLSNPTFTGTVGGITKSMVGLSNVDNTTDAAKPLSTAVQAALAQKANVASPTFTGVVSGITKAMVGLTNVDNTADNAKPISTAVQVALDAKAPLNAPAFTGTVYTESFRLGLSTTPGYVLTTDAQGNATWQEPSATATAGVSTVNGRVGNVVLSKTDVGLANVDNTTDVAKPVSTATTNALNLKANIASPTFTGVVSGITKAMVGLGNVDNTSDANAPVSAAMQTALDAKAFSSHTHAASEISSGVLAPARLGSGTASASNYLRGDGTWQILTKADFGLGSVDNTSDAAKPISTATQNALNVKANIAAPTFTGLVSVTSLRVGTTSTSGYVLTTDNTGTASWQALPSSGTGNAPAPQLVMLSIFRTSSSSPNWVNNAGTVVDPAALHALGYGINFWHENIGQEPVIGSANGQAKFGRDNISQINVPFSVQLIDGGNALGTSFDSNNDGGASNEQGIDIIDGGGVNG